MCAQNLIAKQTIAVAANVRLTTNVLASSQCTGSSGWCTQAEKSLVKYEKIRVVARRKGVAAARVGATPVRSENIKQFILSVSKVRFHIS